MTDDDFDDYHDEPGNTDGVDEDVDTEPDAAVDEVIDAPRPGAWTQPAATGVPSVDAAIEELSRLDELPTSEHVAIYEGLHGQLQDALADLDGS